MRVLAISPAAPTLSALLEPRVNNPLRSLQRQGLIDGFTTTGIVTDHLQALDCSFDTVLIQRAVPEYIYLQLVSMGVPFVLDVDDNLLAEAAYRVGSFAEISLITGLRYATVVSAPTVRLIELLEKYSSVPLRQKAVVTPNSLPYPSHSRPPSQPSRLVWIQGDIAAMTTNRESVIRAVEDFSRRYELPIILIGRKVIECDGFTHMMPMGEIDFHALLQFLEFTPTAIGIAPLETTADQGTLDFIGGKSDIKLLFFDGYGHPGIYSNAPPYTDSPLSAGARVIGNSYAEWSQALEFQYREGWHSVSERSKEIRHTRHIDRVARESWLTALENARSRKAVAAADFCDAFAASRLKSAQPGSFTPPAAGASLPIPEMEIDALRRELLNLRGSLSWKVTAPLRALAKPFMERKSR